ncbi:MAG: 4Fe-4S binding protein [Deltaproteobacteria bacterium]|nr:4Fe-4S binding protein [Deltaproteobacteria bacterium]
MSSTGKGLPIVGDQAYYRTTSRVGLRHARRAVQLVMLVLFLALFLVTRDQGLAPLPPTLFLQTDPLVALLTIGAARVLVPSLLVGSLFFVLFTLVFGRAFCGWICPLGTLFDLTNRALKTPEDRVPLAWHTKLQYAKYLILVVMVAGALCSAQWLYLLDPLVLLFRALAVGVWPVATLAHDDPEAQGTLWQAFHGVTFGPLALLAATLAAVAIAPRSYCRYLCPLGAFYGLLSRAPLLRRRVEGCDACTGVQTQKQCVAGCRMGAVAQNPHLTQNHECIRCMSGRSFCHAQAIHFDVEPRTVLRQDPEDVPAAISRRAFLASAGAGLALAPMAALSSAPRNPDTGVVRPPGVLDEDAFTDQCIRCAMCVQACPTQTLQLTHLEAGFTAFWTPAITPAVGGCVPECNACSVACPTDAIPDFAKDERSKWATKMGTAVLEKGRCISHTEDTPCAKCLDICPTKAFVVESEGARTPRRPEAVDYVRCVGCGLCELECAKIVYGTPALRTFAHGRGQLTALHEAPTTSFSAPTIAPAD